MEQTMGLEPTTSAMARRRSSQLSYVCVSVRIGAGGRVRTGTSKGWSLSALAHLSYPRTTPPNKGEYRKYFMISNYFNNSLIAFVSTLEFLFSISSIIVITGIKSTLLKYCTPTSVLNLFNWFSSSFIRNQSDREELSPFFKKILQ